MEEVKKINIYCFALINLCLKQGATKLKLTQEGVTCRGKKLGNWELTIKKVK